MPQWVVIKMDQVIVSTAGISTNIGDVVQFTGIATISDAYYRITNVPAVNRIGIARLLVIHQSNKVM